MTVVMTFVSLLGVSASARAQSAIAGVVEDASNAALPGVTVVASSPALIEKSRSTVTDSSGQYKIVDLRPGTYTVTFTLSGFRTVQRESIELTASFTAAVNATMSVGELKETITVSGAAPIVDVQSTLQQTVLPRAVLDAVPNSRNIWAQAALIPGVQPSVFDVGGTQGLFETTSRVHGSVGSDQAFKIEGMGFNTTNGDGGSVGLYMDDSMMEEIGFQTSALPAEHAQGGITYNIVLKDGGNLFRGTAFLSGSSDKFQADNLTQELKDRGLQFSNSLIRIHDANVSFGGPIVEDKLWFFFSFRHQQFKQYVGGIFDSDGSKAIDDNKNVTGLLRLTMNVNQRNKASAFYTPYWKSNPTRRDRTAEYNFIDSRAATYQTTPIAYGAGVRWTSTATNKLLLDSGFAIRYVTSARGPQPSLTNDDIAHVDFTQSTLTGSAITNLRNLSAIYRWTESLSYVTGSHAFKVGIQYGWGTFMLNQSVTQAMVLRFSNGVANAVDLYNSPTFAKQDVDTELGLYAQDSWTRGQLTLNPGVRFDKLVTNLPVQNAPAGPWVGERNFPAVKNVPNWSNTVPRLGVAYDLFGSGRTVVKASASKYMQGQSTQLAQSVNPMILTFDRRSWSDPNRNGIAEFLELGPSTGFRGGVNTRIDPDIQRPYNWEFTVGVDHELRSGFGVAASYYRREFANQTGTRNLAVPPSEYSPVTIQNPLTGQPLTVYNQSAGTVGRQDNLLQNQEILDTTYNGVEFRANARFGNGNLVRGGVTIGRKEAPLSGDLNNPNVLINFIGADQFDSSVQVKVHGIYQLPWSVQLSANVNSMTGYPLRRIYTVTRTQVPGLSQVTQAVDLVPRGEARLPRVNLIDLKVTRVLRWGDRTVEPQVSLYNILNENPTTSEVEAVGPTLGRPVTILAARMISFGVHVKF